MSIEMMARVWNETPIEGTRLLCMLALADYANPDGFCYPAIETLAGKCRLKDRRHMQRVMRVLQEEGYVEVIRESGKKGQARLYRIHPTPPTDGAASTPPQEPEVVPDGAASTRETAENGTDGAAPQPPKPSSKTPHTRESLVEPSVANGEKNAIRKAAEDIFRQRTELEPPKSKTEAGTLWWSPLREICELARWDAFALNDIIVASVDRCERDGLTISSPKSILKTARAIRAEKARGHRTMPGAEPKGFAGTREWLNRKGVSDGKAQPE